MKPALSIVTLATAAILAVSAAGVAPGHAEEDGIEKTKVEAFDARMFAKPPGNKAYACFVRRYDSSHLARHPRQKVGAMKLLVSAEIPSDENTTNYSFRLGIKFRHRSGIFDSSGHCHHIVAEDAGHEVRFACGVDCDGGGIGLALSKDDKAAIIRLEQVRIWKHNKPDDESGGSLDAGADDGTFQLDRTDPSECASLLTEHEEVAALQHK